MTNLSHGHPAIERRPAASHLAAVRPPGRRAYALRRLAGRGGPALVADAAARPARRAPLALQGALGVRGLARAARPIPTRRCRAARRAAFRERHAFWIGDWEASPGGGASPTRCASSASGRRCAATRAERGVRLHRRRADLRRARARRPPRPAGALPRAASWPARRPTPSPTTGQLWGNPLYDWPRAAARAATAGGSSGCAAPSTSTTSARIDHFRGFVAYWAVPEGARDARGGRWQRGPGARRFEPRARELRRAAASSPRTSASSRRPVRAAARRARLPGHGRPAVRLRPRRPATARTVSRTTASDQVALHGDARQRHAARLVGDASDERRGATRSGAAARPASDEPRAVVGARSRLALALARAAVRCCRPRTCSASATRRG